MNYYRTEWRWRCVGDINSGAITVCSSCIPDIVIPWTPVPGTIGEISWCPLQQASIKLVKYKLFPPRTAHFSVNPSVPSGCSHSIAAQTFLIFWFCPNQPTLLQLLNAVTTCFHFIFVSSHKWRNCFCYNVTMCTRLSNYIVPKCRWVCLQNPPPTLPQHADIIRNDLKLPSWGWQGMQGCQWCDGLIWVLAT